MSSPIGEVSDCRFPLKEHRLSVEIGSELELILCDKERGEYAGIWLSKAEYVNFMQIMESAAYLLWREI